MVRVLGGCYLVALGIRLLFSRPDQIDLAVNATVEDTESPGTATVRSRVNSLMFGFLVTLTNPKAIVLFASVFATAVTSETPAWLLGPMIALVVVSALVWYSIVTLFMASAPVIERFGRGRHRIEQIAGVCFAAIGGRILADGRNPVAPSCPGLVTRSNGALLDQMESLEASDKTVRATAPAWFSVFREIGFTRNAAMLLLRKSYSFDPGQVKRDSVNPDFSHHAWCEKSGLEQHIADQLFADQVEKSRLRLRRCTIAFHNPLA